MTGADRRVLPGMAAAAHPGHHATLSVGDQRDRYATDSTPVPRRRAATTIAGDRHGLRGMDTIPVRRRHVVMITAQHRSDRQEMGDQAAP